MYEHGIYLYQDREVKQMLILEKKVKKYGNSTFLPLGKKIEEFLKVGEGETVIILETGEGELKIVKK